ncbi:DUF2336 domain-containing protein [Chelatococcus sp. SYSU_G07232]|uniref:DUF2336 domain-containing protein n=1 Tax=Chelatococcus albus TaxID=3047466 RepID=A0ABT7AHA6_9HYPH|nr:DUF2336 domain-containing protein [Chelatococcus sp. SYSU_G07232]MDJ1158757.1 DUF2336 domain-containing protein [Chelatococcus sp. SYSU_G07232]
MSAVLQLVRELDDAIAERSVERRTEALRRVTDLFLRDAPAYADDQVALFDTVLVRLAGVIETQARAELAERLAGVANAPAGVVRSLAHDEIAVARPVLTRSARLSDEDLVSVATAKGQDHMAAIAMRRTLAQTVTDVLVERGDDAVVRTVAGNSGARFSPAGMDRLVERARIDEPLQTILGRRRDMSDAQLGRLIAIAKETVRQRLTEDLPAEHVPDVAVAIDLGARVVEAQVRARAAAAPRDYEAAEAEIERLAGLRRLDETALAVFASNQRFEESVCALAALCEITRATAERVLTGDADLAIILGRAKAWSWPTVRALLKLAGRNGGASRAIGTARDIYDELSIDTARRVLRFVRVREHVAEAGRAS